MKTYDPYELMIIPPNKKTEMIVGEIKGDETNLNLVRDLITLGANLDWRDEEFLGMTVLHIAVFWNNMEAVRILVEAGADVNAQDDDGCTPYDLASLYMRDDELREYLMLRTNLTANFNNGNRRI
jgi:ankyrin repeat protein